ncbi:MAG: glycosyltransferase [Burkholderiaceae bacterium]
MHAVDISIIVATCNRASGLRDLLEALLRSECPSGLSWDVCVVDNNSRDETAAVVTSFAQRDRRIRYVFESVQGKSHALNRGVRHAGGKILAFTDDDCIPDPHWIDNIGAAFAADPGLGLLGGRVELFNADDHPTTTRTWHEQRLVSSANDALSLIIGCNMAVRSDLLRTIGDFDPLMTPGSHKDAVFEDTDFIYRAFKRGIRIEYRPNILLHHNHGRRLESDVADVKRKYVRGRGSFYAKHIADGDRTAMKLAYWEVHSTLISLAKNVMTGKSPREDMQMISQLFAGALTRFTR